MLMNFKRLLTTPLHNRGLTLDGLCVSHLKKNCLYYRNIFRSHEKNNTVVKVTPPSKNIVLLLGLEFGQPEKVVISIFPPN